ncbi:hypothetical protein TIFTF001_052362 [Ficus carica]|uniref:Uncharacterized protein n=1 Tax=Ficus carica TaxID=3494 RepID=A0AA88JH29_FICCA|nr:hypothetical protein TIFTF001_052362 [Ficus carica]
MHHERYYQYMEFWRAYPAESMGHYCRRFQEAMLPHIPQDIPSPGLQALVILRNGLPSPIRQYVPAPTPDMTVGHMIEYILGAEAIVHALQAGPVEPGAPADDVDEPEPVYEPEPVEEPEPVYEPGPVSPEDPMAVDQEDPEEIPIDDGDGDADSDAASELLEQQQETNRLREQLAQMNQRPQVGEVPPPVHQTPPAYQVPPVVPPAPEAQPEIPRNAEIPMAPVGGQVHVQPVREDLLYERFRRMKAPEFEGTTDPIAADNWLIDIQVILNFMRLTEQEKVLCASFALKKDARHWWMTVQMRRDVMVVITKFLRSCVLL